MANYGYTQNADVCARSVFVAPGHNRVAFPHRYATGPTLRPCPPNSPMWIVAAAPELSGICVISVMCVLPKCRAVQPDAKQCEMRSGAMTQPCGAMTQNAPVMTQPGSFASSRNPGFSWRMTQMTLMTQIPDIPR
jgi:hypothetical protein